MSEAGDTVHGGRLLDAAETWQIPRADWLDVSTGIAPWSWPVGDVPGEVWARLPEADDGLIPAAAAYYGVSPERLVAVPGSQFAIQTLPALRRPGRVGVPSVGYREHARAWARAGHQLVYYDTPAALVDQVAQLDHAVVLAPNNPLGDMPDTDQLRALAATLGPGRLIVDAAFMDCVDAPPALPASAIVLRSVGKFFGLAGIRLGFVCGPPDALAPLDEAVQPWGVAHPARWIGRRALADTAWQIDQRARIHDGQAWLRDVLAAAQGARIVSGGLFVTALFQNETPAPRWHAALARQGILTRLGDDNRWLRVGLAPHAARARLRAGLQRAGVYPQGR